MVDQKGNAPSIVIPFVSIKKALTFALLKGYGSLRRQASLSSSSLSSCLRKSPSCSTWK